MHRTLESRRAQARTLEEEAVTDRSLSLSLSRARARACAQTRVRTNARVPGVCIKRVHSCFTPPPPHLSTFSHLTKPEWWGWWVGSQLFSIWGWGLPGVGTLHVVPTLCVAVLEVEYCGHWRVCTCVYVHARAHPPPRVHAHMHSHVHTCTLAYLPAHRERSGECEDKWMFTACCMCGSD